MMADAYSTYVNLFLALDALWDECHDDTLAGYLSEANPFLFKDGGSADPAIWSEFSAAFSERFPLGEASLKDAHDFVFKYLESLSDEYSDAYRGDLRLSDAFLEIAPIQRWADVFESHDIEGRAI